MSDNSYWSKNESVFFERWKELLRIPSISADSAYHRECVRAANFLSDYLKSLGLQAELIQTSGKPLVFAELKKGKDLPTVLMYGHYDVQPADPLDEWISPPFAPEIREEKMYARGAVDDKGQMMALLSGVEWALTEGGLNCNLKILIEGEEETGSFGLNEILPKLSERIKADILAVADTGTFDKECPALTLGLRGMAELEFVLSGPSQDAHSGVFGGVIKNPASELARLVASLHDDRGRIAVEGFYDGVQPTSAEEKSRLSKFPLTEESFEGLVGVSLNGGEEGYSLAERRGVRPTLEVNGLHSGYGGEGGKTIIPASALVKISIRTVKGQDSQRCIELVRDHLVRRVPQGMKGAVTYCRGGGKGISLDPESTVVKKVIKIINNEFKKDPLCIWEGASIPILSALSDASGAEPVLIGFGLADDNLHSPNEKFDLSQFRQGARFMRAFMRDIKL